MAESEEETAVSRGGGQIAELPRNMLAPRCPGSPEESALGLSGGEVAVLQAVLLCSTHMWAHTSIRLARL